MAIRAVAGRVLFNEQNHLDTNPVIQFQSLDENSHFSFCFWAKPVEQTQYDAIFAYNGNNGAQIIIGYQLGKWFVNFNSAGGISQSVGFFEDAIVGRWTLICFSFSGRDMKAYTGHENVPPGVNDPNNPVVVFQIGEGHVDDNLSITPFAFLHLAPSHNTAMCNVKYWNRVLTMAEFTTESNKWLPGDAMWSSPLRTPGDISSIANPRTSPDWYKTHGYELEGRFIRSELEISLPDPAYLATQPCPAWVFPLIGPDEPIFVDFNPSVTPVADTTYKSTKFWQYEDRGAVPRFVTSIQSIEYYAYPFHTGTGIVNSDSWPLLIDNNGTELVTSFTPTFRFEQDTGVGIPGPVGAMNGVNMYQYKFGGQFTWKSIPTQSATATANLGYPRLYLIYTGFPTGDPTIPADILTGIFIINKGGKSADGYNLGVEVKIPNPTVRTAFIGE